MKKCANSSLNTVPANSVNSKQIAAEYSRSSLISVHTICNNNKSKTNQSSTTIKPYMEGLKSPPELYLWCSPAIPKINEKAGYC